MVEYIERIGFVLHYLSYQYLLTSCKSLTPEGFCTSDVYKNTKKKKYQKYQVQQIDYDSFFFTLQLELTKRKTSGTNLKAHQKSLLSCLALDIQG